MCIFPAKVRDGRDTAPGISYSEMQMYLSIYVTPDVTTPRYDVNSCQILIVFLLLFLICSAKVRDGTLPKESLTARCQLILPPGSPAPDSGKFLGGGGGRGRGGPALIQLAGLGDYTFVVRRCVCYIVIF